MHLFRSPSDNADGHDHQQAYAAEYGRQFRTVNTEIADCSDQICGARRYRQNLIHFPGHVLFQFYSFYLLLFFHFDFLLQFIRLSYLFIRVMNEPYAPYSKIHDIHPVKHSQASPPAMHLPENVPAYYLTFFRSLRNCHFH